MPELFPLVRRVDFIGAYDLTRPESSRNYGIHNMEIRFAVVGARGAITINMSTNWYLPQNQQSSFNMLSRYPFDSNSLMMPNITDVGYHARVSQYEGQPEMSECHLLGCPCYYDGSALWGNEEWRLGFLHGGTDWLWPRMEEEYEHRFHDGPLPDLTPIPRKHPDEK
jgi:hypothetical protein